ncbi:hypothetical protein GOPIP_031_01680 [Gordonia polyisoprenivorans NBRC 16320 = JCM 10675]|uniref:Uncharacterized protein n=1 Tax=Gordonia polyisoprenivorans TaxID=84595 RepID=A0A846WJC4_9ACTN|nr:hypothetical protein [Gordonia polyisoprenivorans]NKY00940.1 hypothetical protein [Gordonia polyisoprenivorans]UZF56750.1 hypothetical protein LH935_01685 [Gordonia polyisoprenivorans]GAB22548.1 hypothetical protein GOPIP_031_01680 [Gordonia polyisoprenivorans NBRC 16320 = JCM 10675]
MATAILGDDQRRPHATLTFASSLTICLLVRQWALPAADRPGGGHAAPTTPLDQMRVTNPCERPADPLWSEFPPSVVAVAWQHWWDLMVGMALQRSIFDPSVTPRIDTRLTDLSERPYVQRWVAREKRAFTRTRPRVLPPGMTGRLTGPLSIHVVAASGVQLLPLAADNFLATADLVADPDEYSRQLSAYIDNLH